MRLTLRTMLAWLDNVLDPADAELLGKKIDESTFATDLVQKIRTVTKKVRMNAPKLDGKGLGSDANTVAEYLDSELPQDRVGDFERVCLESDAHLAEVACTHQVLTIVLGKAAEVPPQLRDRVYALGTGERSTPVAKAAAPRPASTAQPATAGDDQPLAEVPDYLRSGRKEGVGKWIAVAVAVVLLLAIGLRLLGPFDGSHPIAKLLGGGQPVVINPPPVIPAPPVPTPPPPVPVEVPPPMSEGDGDSAPMPMPPVEPMPVRPAVPAPPVDPPATPPVEPGPMPVPTPAPVPTPIPAPPIVAEPKPPADEVKVASFLSDEQILAHFVAADGEWLRLPPRAILTSGMRLVALPTFRPQVALASGVQITLAGDSAVRLDPPGESGASRLSVEYGRLLVVTAGGAGAQVELDLAGVQGLATLIDADSVLAIQVKRYLAPGVDLKAGPPIPVVEIFTTSGRVAWHEAGQERVEIPPHHVRVYVGADPAETLGPFASPEWIDAKSITPIDRESSLVLEEALAADRPLVLSLLEKTQDRRVNVRALAARCLAALDQFDSALKELSDQRQYSFWAGEFAALRHALARSETSRTALLETLERLRPAEAAEIETLLVGYSSDQLVSGSASELVKMLEHDQMDVRVLAFQNLFAITGAMEFYRPDRKPEDQKPAIANWKDRAAKGTINYKSPPSPIDAYKPLDKPADGTVPRPT
ncbi:MAG: hypothetical protein SFU86_02655 [Pirellulaceae bacterium]|nr:hypothetical protein [Pirellulaceae bacterium]